MVIEIYRVLCIIIILCVGVMTIDYFRQTEIFVRLFPDDRERAEQNPFYSEGRKFNFFLVD
jgi:hypothetical protein